MLSWVLVQQLHPSLHGWGSPSNPLAFQEERQVGPESQGPWGWHPRLGHALRLGACSGYSSPALTPEGSHSGTQTASPRQPTPVVAMQRMGHSSQAHIFFLTCNKFIIVYLNELIKF